MSLSYRDIKAALCNEEEELDFSGNESEKSDYTYEGSNQSDAEDAEQNDYQAISGEFYYGKNMLKWKKTPYYPVNTRQLARNIVRFSEGPKGSARELQNEFELWNLLVNDEMLERITENTNKKLHVLKRNYSKEQRYLNEMTKKELLALIGLLYMSGSLKSGGLNLNDLWSSQYGPPIFRATMSENRFKFLIRCLRFDDYETRQERRAIDKFAPIREIFRRFAINCQKYYEPSSNTTIDEALLSFRGRCPFKIYIPSKPDKYGIKIVMMCDSNTSYMTAAIPYVGKENRDKSVPIPTKYVLLLTETISGSNRNVTMDNWFTSVELAEKLLERKLTMVGTIRKNKPHIPPEFLSAKKDEVMTSKFGYDKNKTLVSFVPKKNKVVLLISTKHTDGVIDSDSKKPEIILDYNATKGGVDTLDQLCHSKSVARKTKRWPLRVFYGILDIAGINSLILSSANIAKNERNWKDRGQYLKNLSCQLVKPHINERHSIPNLPNQTKFLIQTFLGQNESKTDSNVSTAEISTDERKTTTGISKTRCSICPRKADRKTSVICYKCKNPVCPEHRIHLCTNCN